MTARAVLANAGGALLVLVVLALSFAATRVRDTAHLRPGWSTAADVPGTCHRDTDYFESFLAQAELTPPVPCSEPHNVEVAWKVRLRGVLAKQHDRPTPEMMAGQYAHVCDDRKLLNRYIGIDSVGYLYYLQVYPRFPSAPEWRAGLRVARCVVAPSQVTNQTPMLSFAVRDSWDRAESAAIRLCAVATRSYVPCSAPHTQEVLDPVSPFPRSRKAFPSPALSRKAGLRPCTKAALQFLGRKTMPAGLHVIVEPAEPQNWPHNHDVGCRIGSASRTGSLQAGLT